MGANEKVAATFHGPCVRCGGEIQNDRHAPCCSSHGKMLCCQCYSRTHFVDTGCCGPQFAREPIASPPAEVVDEITADVYRLERDALRDALDRVLDALPTCRFCGQPFRAVACGPHHAVVAEDPASHWIFKGERG